MPSLVNMKLGDMEQELELEGRDAPAFPFGLSVHLDNVALDKLNMSLPKVGEIMDLAAAVKVTSVSANEQGDKLDRSVTLQITDMSLEDEKTQAETLFGVAETTVV